MADISDKALAELAHHFRTLIMPYEGLDHEALADAIDEIRARDRERVRAIEDYWGRIAELAATLREARRFMDYFANGHLEFSGPGTPKSCLAQIDDALAKVEG